MLSQARLFQLAALHTAAPTLQSTNVYLTHQQTEDLLRPSTPLSSYCCQAHHCHQTAAKHTTVIKRLPGTALSSNCCQAHRYHQIAAKHIPVIKLLPSTPVIKLLPGTAVSSKLCQAHHCHQTTNNSAQCTTATGPAIRPTQQPRKSMSSSSVLSCVLCCSIQVVAEA